MELLLDSLQLSPELALVDPELAAQARRELGPPGAVAAVAAASLPCQAEPALPARAAPTGRLPRGSQFLASAALALAVLPFLAGAAGHPLGRDEPARSASRLSDVPESPIGRAVLLPPAQAAPRRFVWAHVNGARRYVVAFFRGDAPVFRATALTPTVLVPVRWRFAGRMHTLSPGDYRWYVWPVYANGRRSETAVVRARLHVD